MRERLRERLGREGNRGDVVRRALDDLGSRSLTLSVRVRLATVAKLAVAVLVVSAATLALVGVGSQGALAASVAASDVSIETNDGNVTAVTVAPTLTVSWDALEKPVEQILLQVKISAASDDRNDNVLGGSQFLDCAVESHPDCGERSGNVTFDYGGERIDILNRSRYSFVDESTLFEASDFAAVEEGQTRTTPVFVRITARADFEDGTSKFFSQDLAFDVTVTNREGTLSIDGSLDTGVTG
jgi:hypothetical protein